LCGNPAPSREKGKGITAYAESSLAQYRPDKIGGTIKASGGVLAGGSETFVTWPAKICSTLNANFGSKLGLENQHINEGAPMFVPYDLKQVTSKENHQLSRKVGDPCHTLAKENACGSAVVAIQGNLIGRDSGGPQGVGASDDGVMYTLTKADVHGVAQPIGFDAYNNDVTGDVSKTIDTGQDYHHVPNLWQGMAVRRLTPVECERLQGFPDNYTNIRENCPDGPRYKALGNSMAVPVMRWIGERIQAVERI
jgi:DNA (cytosine-5)-methyltransferase 1